MATQVKVGAIIRRGAETITPETMRILVESEARVVEIIAEIDARSAVFLELERSTQAAAAALEDGKSDLVARETALSRGQVELVADRSAADQTAAANITVLARRTAEIATREQDADDRDTGLEVRAAALDDRAAKHDEQRAAFVALVRRVKELNLEQVEAE